MSRARVQSPAVPPDIVQECFNIYLALETPLFDLKVGGVMNPGVGRQIGVSHTLYLLNRCMAERNVEGGLYTG